MTEEPRAASTRPTITVVYKRNTIDGTPNESYHVIRISMSLSEEERHAIAHAKYLVDRATPDNPEVCFDYTLVATLLKLTAAAEVQGKSGYQYVSSYDEIVAATIERCAQVADNYLRPICYVEREHPVRNEIAAAIRRLKESP